MRYEPQKLIEGCLIAGYAVNAHICYIYIRGEYFNEGKRLQKAIDQAYEKNYLGKMRVCVDGIYHIHRSRCIYMWGGDSFIREYEGNKKDIG